MRLILSLLLLLSPSLARAALTLTVDTSTKTLSWSGDASVSGIDIADFSQTVVGITTGLNNTYNGGTASTSQVASGPGLTVVVNSDITSVPPSANANPTIWANTTNFTDQPTVSVLLSLVLDFTSGPNTTSFTVTANGGGSYDYSTLGPDQEALLESQDGVDLFFSDTTNQTNLGNAGTIAVVPEPSSMLLATLGTLGLAFGRRRRG